MKNNAPVSRQFQGYSGYWQGKNNPSAETIQETGPIPRGHYTIGLARTHPHLGLVVMALTPDPDNNMFGRSGFYIHGDDWTHPGESSHGCIVLNRPARDVIAKADDRELWVVQ